MKTYAPRAPVQRALRREPRVCVFPAQPAVRCAVLLSPSTRDVAARNGARLRMKLHAFETDVAAAACLPPQHFRTQVARFMHHSTNDLESTVQASDGRVFVAALCVVYNDNIGWRALCFVHFAHKLLVVARLFESTHAASSMRRYAARYTVTRADVEQLELALARAGAGGGGVLRT